MKLRFSCYFFEALCLCCLLGSHAQITLDELDQWVQVVLKSTQNTEQRFFCSPNNNKKEAFPPCLHQQLGVSTKPFSHKTPNKAAGWEFMCHPSTTASIPDAWKTRMEDRPTENPVLGCKQHDGQIPKPRILHAMQTALGWVRSNILPFEMGDVYVYLHAHFLHNDTHTKKRSHSKVRWAKKGAFQFKMCRHTSLSQNKQTNKQKAKEKLLKPFWSLSYINKLQPEQHRCHQPILAFCTSYKFFTELKTGNMYSTLSMFDVPSLMETLRVLSSFVFFYSFLFLFLFIPLTFNVR